MIPYKTQKTEYDLNTLFIVLKEFAKPSSNLKQACLEHTTQKNLTRRIRLKNSSHSTRRKRV